MLHIKQFFNKLIDWVEMNQKKILILSCLLTFLLIFLDINRTQYWADDLTYMNIFGTNEKIYNISDIFTSQFTHYFTWGGRSIVHALLQFFLLIEKPFSSIICALAYVGLILLICSLPSKIKEIRLSTFWLTTGLLYFLNPIWEETVTWMTGNANYFFGILFGLIPVYFYFKKRNSNKISLWDNIVFFVLCFIAGWSIESVGPSIFVMLLILWWNGNVKERKLLVIGIIAVGIGCTLLIAAPGNFIRNTVLIDDFGGYNLKLFIYRAYNANYAIFNYLLTPIALGSGLLYYEKKVNNLLSNSLLFFSIGIFSILLMVIAAPSYPSRATYGSFIFLLVSCIYSIIKTNLQDSRGFLLVSFIFLYRIYYELIT